METYRLEAEAGDRRRGWMRACATGVWSVLMGLAVLAVPRPARAIKLGEEGDISVNLGMRIQPRMELERLRLATGPEWRRDFLLRRSRIWLQGKVHGADYKLQWKVDNEDLNSARATASVEDAYIQYPLNGSVSLRAGLYDQPYSRDRLTSDGKQLAVDRGSVSDVPNTLGLVDNAVGLHLLGKLNGGHVEYAVGAFDNRLIASRFQDVPMFVGRLDFNFGSTKNVFMDMHEGTETWCSLGVNGNYQSSLQDSTGVDKGKNAAAGVDGMIDVPWNGKRVLVRSEFNTISVTRPAGGNSLDTKVWMVGAGLLVKNVQPIVRFDRILRDQSVGGGTANITFAGINFYQKGHNLKLQTDVRFEAGTGEAVDGARFQAQVEF